MKGLQKQRKEDRGTGETEKAKRQRPEGKGITLSGARAARGASVGITSERPQNISSNILHPIPHPLHHFIIASVILCAIHHLARHPVCYPSPPPFIRLVILSAITQNFPLSNRSSPLSSLITSPHHSIHPFEHPSPHSPSHWLSLLASISHIALFYRSSPRTVHIPSAPSFTPSHRPILHPHYHPNFVDYQVPSPY